MHLRIDKESPMYGELYDILQKEQKRHEDFKEWQVNNLPPFNAKVLSQRSPFYIYPNTVGWKFEGDVDPKVWQNVKGWPDYYEPNKRTKAGKAMRSKINQQYVGRLHRFGFFDIFKTTIPRYGKSFTVPIGFIYEDAIYFVFDDGNYKDIKEHCAGMYTEITHGEWERIVELYDNQE